MFFEVNVSNICLHIYLNITTIMGSFIRITRERTNFHFMFNILNFVLGRWRDEIGFLIFTRFLHKTVLFHFQDIITKGLYIDDMAFLTLNFVGQPLLLTLNIYFFCTALKKNSVSVLRKKLEIFILLK